MPHIVRPATLHDRDALVEQFLGLNVYEEPIAQNRRTDRQGAVESLTEAWLLVHEADGNALVAELDGRIVGHLFLLFKRDPVFVREELRRYAYVSELFVRPEARGIGVGKALMEEAERIAASRGMTRLMVGVLSGNASGEAFYDRRGYRPFAIELNKHI